MISTLQNAWKIPELRKKLIFTMLMLLAYSMGLGIPFVLSAVLIDYLKTAFGWIKRHYTLINAVSGAVLILIGVLMMTGLLNRFLNLLN